MARVQDLNLSTACPIRSNMVQIPPEVQVGILTAGAALLGVIIQSVLNYRAQGQAIEAANRRASADYLLQKEADGLMNLLQKAEHCHAVTYKFANRASGDREISEELLGEVNTAMSEFESAARVQVVFLDDDAREEVRGLLGTLRTATEGGRFHIQNRPEMARDLIDWMELHESFEGLRDRVEPLLNERINELRETDGVG